MSKDPPSIDEFPDFLTTVQVARIFAVTTQTIRDWLERGLFEGAVRPGGRRWRIPKQAVKDLVNERHG